MKPIDIFIRYSDLNVRLDKIATLSQEENLIYNDDGGNFKAHMNTLMKFTILTVTSPLITLARLIRSVAFIFTGKAKSAGREFLGALATPLITAGSLAGTLIASLVYVISAGHVSLYTTMRRTYSAFEAWVNEVNPKSPRLRSYSHRVSGTMEAFKGRVWTTAPCMQPIFENGLNVHDGLLDRARIQKLFPSLQVNNVLLEQGKVVIQSEYTNSDIHYIACNGAYEHKKISADCCCCYRVDTVYDRILCCELGRGTCSSVNNSGDSCGIVSCGCGGIGACCCYTKENDSLTSLNTGCFGPEGLFYKASIRRVIA
jgi:hypothetical protein